MRLTNKQRAFVEFYLQTWNASEAARLAGYSEHTARVIGPENLSKPAIKAAIDRRLEQLAMGANEVLARLSQHAGGSMEDFVTLGPMGWFIDLEKAKQRGKLHLIKKIKQDKDGITLELYDAQAALVQVGKHHKLFVDRVEIGDWREEAQKTGRLAEATAAFEKMVDEFSAILAADAEDGGGGMGESESS